ncbi:hypothetical protein H4219_001050 [Mycoemilia scoparia]|uniref:Zn(2)-C6 fungal-type domain-containing protein n=1 Tax=Mycoemilia scoparia TaxID=417184 RepID=A0A9W8A7L0_9FUNG|nr:hypothetical protein H4219_001050 [Mycoemilia scoparia]
MAMENNNKPLATDNSAKAKTATTPTNASKQANASKRGTTSSSSTTAQSATTKTASPVRKRLSLACTTCRQRKVKCDGGRPSCKTCAKFNWPCVYQPSNRKRGPRPRALALLDTSPGGLYPSQSSWSTGTPPHHPYSGYPGESPSMHRPDYRVHPTPSLPHHVRYLPYSTPPGVPGLDRTPISADPGSSSLSSDLRLYKADNFRSYGDFLSQLASPSVTEPIQHGRFSGPFSHNRRSPISQALYGYPSPNRVQCTHDTMGNLKAAEHPAGRYAQPSPTSHHPSVLATPVKTADPADDGMVKGEAKTVSEETKSAAPAFGIDFSKLPMLPEHHIISARPQLPPLCSKTTTVSQDLPLGAGTNNNFHAEVEKMFGPGFKPSHRLQKSETDNEGTLSYCGQKIDALTLPPMALLTKPLGGPSTVGSAPASGASGSTSASPPTAGADEKEGSFEASASTCSTATGCLPGNDSGIVQNTATAASFSQVRLEL